MASTRSAAAEPLPQAAPVHSARAVALLLNLAHALDHMFLLIFATAVGTIAAEFGFARWEDLMPYGVGAFVLFGLGSLPSGRLGDLWGRRRMMLLFFFGIGASALLAAATRNAWELAAALTLLGAFASIYHPVGIPMLLQRAPNPGAVIGVNGLAGNLGIAVAALSTGFMVQWFGWRAAFALPGLLAMVCGVAFARICPHETEPPSRRTTKARVTLAPSAMARVFAVMTAASVTGGLLFNFTTNGNAQLLTERFRGIVEDPALLGAMLAAVYALASLAQLVVGRLLDRVALKPLYLGIVRAADSAAGAGRLGAGLVAAGAAAGGDGGDLRLDPLHRRDDRALCRRPHALARGRRAADAVDRHQLIGRVAARAVGQGLELRRAVRRHGGGRRLHAGGGGLAAARRRARPGRSGLTDDRRGGHQLFQQPQRDAARH